MTAARGTRRPHPTRVYKRGRKPSRSSGGKSKSCLLALTLLLLPDLALAAIVVAVVTR